MSTKLQHISGHHANEQVSHGAIELTFFNLFWIFVIMSTVGLFGETVVSFFRDGHWESRAGLIFGPFSPIYGIGGVLITVALNRISERNPLALFAVAGVVGASFEYFAGWFWESAFGIVAWSYQGQPFNFHGHTSLGMACVWGLLGMLWMKLALPLIMTWIDRIPHEIRHQLTAVLVVVLLADVLLTMTCIDCWYLRMAGDPIDTPLELLCSQFFNDQFMQSRFETMSMWTSLASR